MEKPQFETPEARTLAIRSLNDAFRRDLWHPNYNLVLITEGIDTAIGDTAKLSNYRKKAELFRLVADFQAFDEGNDPYGEHDFGAFDWEGQRCYFKIDYYEARFDGKMPERGSPDPANAAVTCRVLTIMLQSEY
jgi:hypothetical protein